MELTPFQKLVAARRSVRRFLNTPVPRDKIRMCLEAARLAPSAENKQTWRFLVVDDPSVRDAFAREVFTGIYGYTKFAAKAPVLVLLLSRPDLLADGIGKQIQGISFYFLDMGIAGEHIVLQAQELGLGTCWMGWFNVRRARKFFKIPRKYKIVGMLALGYPQPPPPKERPRKTLGEIAWFNTFGG